MRRVHAHLSEKQIARLRAKANDDDLSLAEIIRRAVDAYTQDAPEVRKEVGVDRDGS